MISKALADDVQVTIGDNTFESYGMTGYGFLPADARDKYGETISFGSSVANQDVTVDEDGVYHFTAYGLPDRGYNVDGTVNTLARIHKFAVDYTPKNASADPNIEWNYEDTILLTDMNGDHLTGLDCNTTMQWNGQSVPAVTYRGDGWGNNYLDGNYTTAICIDSEGLTLIDGDIANGFWISDEYGPSLFRFNSEGQLQEYIQAPNSILPYTDTTINFSSDNTPSWDAGFVPLVDNSGRSTNKGYEGVDVSPDGKYLYALLQSATIQDGGNDSKTRMNTRLTKYDLTQSPPVLVGEYAVVLPTYDTVSSKGKVKVKTAAQSEMRVIAEDIIMVLPRDSDLGHGGEDGTEAIFKHVDLYSLSDADNIMGKYDSINGTIVDSDFNLLSSITPATYYSFIDLLNEDELAAFGLHNGGDSNSTLLNEKWEGMTLIPIECTTDEYYLLLVSDNDYKTTNGYEDFGKITYDAGINVDNQSMMYHVKLPVLPHNSGCSAKSSSSSASGASSSARSSVSASASVSASLSSGVSSAAALSSSAPVSSDSSSSGMSTSEYSSAPTTKDNMVTIAPVATPVYIWSGVSTSTQVLTFADGSISVPVGGLFKKDVTEQTAILIPTPTVTGWTGTYTTTTVIQMTELLDDGEITVVDVTLLETPIFSSDITSSGAQTSSSGVVPSSFSAKSSNTNAQSMTTVTTIIDGVTETVVVPCSSETTPLTAVETIVDGQTTTITIPCEECLHKTESQSMTTITTVVDDVTETLVIPCDSITAETANSASASVKPAPTTISTKEITSASVEPVPTTVSTNEVNSDSVNSSTSHPVSSYTGGANIIGAGFTGIFALAAFLL